jgi:sortase A
MSARRRWRRRFAFVFLVVGITCVGLWTWSIGYESVYEDWSNWAFDRQVAGQPASWKDYVNDRWRQAMKRAPDSIKRMAGVNTEPQSEPQSGPVTPAVEPPVPDIAPTPDKPLENSLIGRLSIPRLGVRAVVREGTETGILSVALGHIGGTALPGQSGNVAVAGHRDTLFRGLRDVRLGDRIEFETPDKGRYFYKVENTSIVSPNQVSVLNAGLHPELTLVTCYPFNYVGSAPYRFIVKARQLEVDEKRGERVLMAEKRPASATPVHRRLAMKPMPYSDALVSRERHAEAPASHQ